MARQIVVEIVGDARKFTGTLTDVTTKTESLSGRLKNVGKGVAIGAGIASFNLLSNAISLGVSKLDDMHQAFLDDEASQARLQNVIKNTVSNYEDATKAAEEFASAQAKLGFQDDDVRDSIAQLVGQTRDMAEALKLVGLAQDLARAKNIDLAQATDVITKAYNGQARGLAALGVDVAGATGRTQLLARAFQNVNGAAARFANTGEGRVARANAKMNETMEKLGGAIDKVSQIVIPIMVDGLSELVDITGDAIAKVAEFANWLNGALGPALSFIGDLARNVAGAIGAIADGVGKVFNASGGSGSGTASTGGSRFIDVRKSTGSVNIGKFGGSFANGGIVPGPLGSPSLILAHGGETVTPRGGGNGPTIIVNIASFIGSDRDIDRFSDRLAFRLKTASLG